jgi:hypothetical protein
VAPADEDDEVKDYKPRSKGEEKFKNMHKVEVSPHPVAHKHQHTTEEDDVDEAMWPGTKEYKAKFDPKFNKYDPEGETRKKLALKPYGDREDPEDSPVSVQAKGRGRPRKNADKNEEVEQVDELDKKTMASYIKKRTKQLPNIAVNYQMAPSEYAGMAKKYMDKSMKGINRAATKLAKEEVEEIDELSKKTLDNYAVKAVDDVVKRAGYKKQYDDSPMRVHNDPVAVRKIQKTDPKRLASVARAHQKMDAKEEVEIEEEVLSDLKRIVEKKQVMNVKFANGKTEQVDMNTAKAILELHGKVNEESRSKIERMVNSSPTNFMKVVDLAMGGK